MDRLENGLNKLYKVQADVDQLVEAAKVMAVEVEHKVASANVFAEQVRHQGQDRDAVGRLCAGGGLHPVNLKFCQGASIAVWLWR